MNLISNALKFTIQGQIALSLAYDRFHKHIKIQVKDTGVGIKQEEKAKLFTLFGKLESSQTLNTKGIGLGLNISKKIVEACGGIIYLDDSYT